ncbi:MAG: hypothetical protein J1E32_08335 [Treponema sp.]|nr:hypothetical protein [Treponema sp.]
MKKMKIRVMALFGALALAAWGITGCFFYHDHEESTTGVLTDGPLSTGRATVYALPNGSPGAVKLGSNSSIAVLAVANTGIATYAAAGSYSGNNLADAFAAIPDTGSYEITLGPGTYRVTGLTYKGSATIKIKGTGSAKYGTDVLIYGEGTDMSAESTRSTLSFQGSCNVILENVAVQNSYGMTTGTAQAEALGVGGTPFSGTLAAYNCAFLSGQDTICTEGKAWFYDCYIEGDVDFLWMETYSSKVALYENCRIRAIDSRTTRAYFTAPRLAVASTVGKGVVIFNSTLEAENGLKEVYLGRNPWDAESDEKKGTNYFNNYYENVAIVGTKYYGNALNEAIWSGSGAHGAGGQQFVGFKTDTHFRASSSGVGARLTSAQVSAEYAGRNNILNRLYNVGEGCFQEDGAVWDVAALVAANGWSVTSDSSKSKLTSDSTKTNVKYDFTDEGLLKGSDATLTQSGFGQDKTFANGNAGATLTFWIVGDCKITVSGYYSGGATVTHGSSSASYTIATQGASDSAVLSLTGISSAGEKVTVKATADKTYITSIDVQYTSNVDAAWAALKAKLANNATYNLRASGLSGPTYTSTDGKLYIDADKIATDHGATLANGKELTLSVQGAAKITFGNCMYDNAATVTVTNTTTSTPLNSMSISKGDSKTDGTTSYIYSGASGTLKFVPNAQIYLHYVQVEYVY